MSANGSLMAQAVRGLPQGAAPHLPLQAMAAASPAAAAPSVAAACASALKELDNAGVIYSATESWRLHQRYIATGLVKNWL